MKFEILEIKLLKYKWIIVASFIISIVISLFLVSSSIVNKIKILTNYSFIIFMVINFIISFLIIESLKKYYTGNIKITINEKEITLNNKIFKIGDIKDFKVITSFINYPSLKIEMKNSKGFKFYCYNKVDNNFEYFIQELSKQLPKKSKNE